MGNFINSILRKNIKKAKKKRFDFVYEETVLETRNPAKCTNIQNHQRKTNSNNRKGQLSFFTPFMQGAILKKLCICHCNSIWEDD